MSLSKTISLIKPEIKNYTLLKMRGLIRYIFDIFNLRSEYLQVQSTLQLDLHKAKNF